MHLNFKSMGTHRSRLSNRAVHIVLRGRHMHLIAIAAVLIGSARLPADVPVMAEEVHIYRSGVPVDWETLVTEVCAADVVLIGEQHDHAEGHQFQLRLLEAAGQRAPSLGLSLEMFERDVQLVLDEYLAGHISEKSFLEASRPWPRYQSDYRPLVEWCRENGRRVVAANVPRRYVNMVARSGQAALLKLPRSSRMLLPTVPYSMDLLPDYDRALDAVFSAGHGSSGMPKEAVARMKEAQALWDHGMAESILRSRRLMRPVLHVVGSMHCEQGFGITQRLRKRDRKLKVLVVVVRPGPPPADLSSVTGLGDFVVFCGSTAASPPPEN